MSGLAKLQVTIPPELVHDFLSKLHYVSESMSGFELALDRDRVMFQLRPGHESESELIASRIAEIAQKMCQAYRPADAKVLLNRLDRKVPFADDPHPALLAQGELFRYGAGRYGLGPRLLKLVEFFDREIARWAGHFDALPYQFPSLVGADALDRCKYLRSFPHALTFVSHLREDLGAIQDFARMARWDTDRLICQPEQMSGIQCLLSPTVCFHWYAWLQNRHLPAPKSITAVGKCFRYESGNLQGLERLWDFTMREVIFVGPENFVLDQRQRAIELSSALLDRWGLAYEVKSATDPFFIEDFSIQATFQRAFDLKFEVRATLPYKQSSLAAGSFNFHQDFFGRTFNIRDSAEQILFTGCLGFGLERLALAFLAQYGFDQKEWPRAVAEQIPFW